MLRILDEKFLFENTKIGQFFCPKILLLYWFMKVRLL